LSGSNGNGRARGVMVTHPGGGQMRSFETALGLQNAGLLQSYVGGFYFRPESPWGRGVRLFVEGSGSRLEALLRGRCHPQLAPERVKTHAGADLAYLCIDRVARLPDVARRMLPARNCWFDGRVAARLERERPAAVLCYEGCGLRAFEQSRRLGIVSVLDQCNAHIRTGVRLFREEKVRHPEWADSMPWDYPEWFVERCCRELELADAIHIGSDYAKQTLVENGIAAEKIFVNPIAADIRRFEPRPREKADEKFRVLFVGQITQRKGLSYLLEAFRQLRLPNSELLLVGGLVGSGAGLRPYLGENIRHVPSVAYFDLHGYFQSGSIFVMPSLHESGVLAIHEALASGLPVIATPNCGSVVRDGIDGFLVPIRDVEALKEKTLLLYQNRRLREEMGRQARRRAEEFTWAAYQRRVAELFRALLTRADPNGFCREFCEQQSSLPGSKGGTSLQEEVFRVQR
jgi:glycosyltransferase involved in cell wall biosynthesis